MKRSHLSIILLSFVLGACAGLRAGSQGVRPVFVVVTKNLDDQVEVQSENGAARIDISSPTGIGWADFVLESGRMPQEITLRLHLRGLEELRLALHRILGPGGADLLIREIRHEIQKLRESAA